MSKRKREIDVFVSNKGRVRMKNHTTYGTPNKDYFFVKICRKSYAVHQLVAKAFKGDAPSERHTPNHIDNNPQNNAAENLCWSTPEEQQNHSRQTNMLRKSNAFALSKPVEYRLFGRTEDLWIRAKSVRQAAKRLNLCATAIGKVCKGIFRYSGPYQFRWAETKQPDRLQDEIWKQVCIGDQQTECFVSNLGRIKSAKGIISYGTKRKLSNPDEAYRYVQINKKSYPVHVVVATAFLGERPDAAHTTVDHINSVRDDNRACNLAWATASQQQARRHQRQKRLNKPYNVALHRPIEGRKIGTEQWTQFDFMNPAASRLGLRTGNISNCCSGRQKTTGGYEFRYTPCGHDTDLDGEIWKRIKL